MTDDIRHKARAVFLAAIMVLSVVAMSGTFVGSALAQTNAENTSIENVSIEDGTDTIFSTPISNEYLQDIGAPTERNTTNFDAGGQIVDPNLAGPNGLIGVPFQESPYDNYVLDLFGETEADAPGASIQFYDLAVDFADTNGETEEIIIDHSNSLDQGVTVADPTELNNTYTDANIDEEDVRDVTGLPSEVNLQDISVNSDTGEMIISYSTSAPTGGPVEFEAYLHLTTEDPTEGIEPDASTSIDVEVEGPEGDIEDDNYRLVNTGSIGFEGGDLASVSTSSDLDDLINASDFSGAQVSGSSGPVSYNVWSGTILTFQSSDTDSIEFYEVEEDNNGDTVVGSQVLQRGTAPGTATSIDTSNLDENGEYFIGFGESDNNLAYVDMRSLNLNASMADDTVSTEDQVEVDVSSDDIGATEFDGSFQVWFYQAGDDAVGDVVDVEQGNFDGDGEDTVSVDPSDDLTGTGDYYAVVLHDESQVAAQTDTIEVTDPLRERVTIESPQFSDQYARGDIAEFEIGLQNTDEATITLGDRAGQQNFELNVTVRDADGDGSASFLVNTFQLGDGPINADDSEVITTDSDGNNITAGDWMSPGREYPHGVLSTDDGTQIVSAEAHPSIRIGGGSNDNDDIRVVIADGGYDLIASPGDAPASESESRATDRSQLRLQPRTTDAVDVWSAPAVNDPAGVEDIETVDEIATAVNESIVTPQNGTLADEDYLIVQAQSTGLEGVLATTVEEDVPNQDVDDFLDRSESHEITEAFTASELVDLRTTQDLTQVREIVESALEDDERNLPRERTFALPAQLTLLQEDNENQKVLAGTNDLGRLDEYFIMTPVNNETVADLINPPGADDVPQDLSAYTAEEIEQVVEIHPNYDVSTFEDSDGEFNATAAGNFFAANSEFEIPTNEPPTQFNTSFELAPNVGDDAAEDFPLNSFFADDSDAAEQTINWELVEDEVNLDNLETVLEDEERVDRLFLPPRDNYTINGTTEIAAGTTLEHDTQSDVGATPPFFDSGSFVVEYTAGGPNNISFQINESLSERAGQDFTMQIRRANQFGQVTPDGETIEGQITEPAEVFEHVFEDQEGSGQVVDVATVNVSTAGAVQIQNANGDVLGQTLLEEGLNEDVRILLDTPVEESQELTSVIVTSDGARFDNGTVNQTAQYTVAGGQAGFDVSNLDPISTTVEPGQEITVTADVTNTGDTNASKNVELRLDGETLVTEEVTLDAGASQEVSFTVNAPESAGTFTHSVWTEDDDAQGQLTVEEAQPDDETDTGGDDNVTDDNVTEDADDGGAGFGVAAALIALLGAALLAYRRRAE